MCVILVADDEAYLRLLVCETLALDPKLRFVEADDGLSALDQARAICPDLIILDIMMPKLNGLQVCRLLKADPAFGTTPILLISAQTSPEILQAGREAGAAGFMRKPFEEADLVTLVAQSLQTRSI